MYVTGSRAEYGIMKELLYKLDQDSNINLDIVITGTHLDSKFGMTADEIINSGFNVIKKIPIKNTGINEDIVQSLALITNQLSELYNDKHYDLTLILGDRQEMLAVANTAVLFKSPIAHFHGGEVSEGNYDDYIRHALTKLSHLHFTSCETYRKRVIQMGEMPQTVFNIGSMAVDSMTTMNLIPFETLKETYDLPFNHKDYRVVLYHPVTLNSEEETILELNDFVDALIISNQNYVLIGSNADIYSNHISNRFNELKKMNSKFFGLKSLEHLAYVSLLKYSKGLVGNSSSGIIEAASLGIPVLNVGDRQKGRIHGSSVIDCPTQKHDIIQSLEKMERINEFSNPYYKKGSVESAYQKILTFLSSESSLRKEFYDLEGEIKDEN